MKILVIIKTISLQGHLTDVTSVSPVCTSISFSQAAQISPSRGSPYLFQKDQAVNPGLQVKQSSSWPTLSLGGKNPDMNHVIMNIMNHTCSDALTNGSYINHSKLLNTGKLQSTTEIRNIPHHLCGIHHHLLSGSLLDAYTCPQSTQLQGHFPTQPDFIRGGRNLPNIVWLINVGCKWLHYIYEIYKHVYCIHIPCHLLSLASHFSCWCVDTS